MSFSNKSERSYPHNHRKPKRKPVSKPLVVEKPPRPLLCVTTAIGHQVTKNYSSAHPSNVTIFPELCVAPVQKIWRRYVASGPINGLLKIKDLLNAFLVATSTTTLSCIMECLRIKRIRWLAPLTTQGTTVTLNITPTGIDSANNSFATRSESYTDSSASVDKPAYISLKPVSTQPSGSWHYQSTVDKTLFEIFCPTGTIMDIQFQCVPIFSGPLLGYTSTSSVVVPGMLYAQNILTTFVAVGVNSIV